MRFDPSDYQLRAIDWMTERSYSALWLDMGMRKTSSTLAAMQLIADRVEVARWLIVGTPRIAEKVWKAEAAKWDPFRNMMSYCLTAEDLPVAWGFKTVKGKQVKTLKLVEPARIRERVLALSDRHSFLTIHYDLLPRLAKVFLDKWPFDGLVLDESSMVKNSDTSRFKAIKRVRGYVDWMVELTGTPSPNGLEQLWSQIYLMDGGERLGRTLTEFRRLFMEPDARNGERVFSYRPRPGAREEIYALVADICMSMSSEDYQSLPPRIETAIPVYLSAATLAQYRQLQREYIIQINAEDVIEAETAASLSMKLRQWANGTVYGEERAVHVLHSAKLDALEELCEVTPGPVLLASEFRHDRARLVERFKKTAVFLDETPDFEERWNAGKIKLGIMHPAQGAHGLNIQEGGSAACWYGPPNDLELYQQFNKRLHRDGQTADRVDIGILVAQETYDEYAMQRLGEKDQSQRSLINAVKAYVKNSPK